MPTSGSSRWFRKPCLEEYPFGKASAMGRAYSQGQINSEGPRAWLWVRPSQASWACHFSFLRLCM